MKNLCVLALALASAALSVEPAHAQAQVIPAVPWSQSRIELFEQRRVTAIGHNHMALGYYHAAMYARRLGNIAGSDAALKLAREKLNLAYKTADDLYGFAFQMDATDALWYIGVADTIIALLGSTHYTLQLALTKTAWETSEDGVPATFFPADNTTYVQFPNGGYQFLYEDGSTTIKIGPNADTIHLTAMGSCASGCQIQGASVFFPPDHGRLGDSFPLPFDPIGPFAAAMMAQDVMMNQALP